MFLVDPTRCFLYEDSSPERNCVIWCGKNVARRPVFPADLYARLQDHLSVSVGVELEPTLFESLDEIYDAVHIGFFEDAVDKLAYAHKSDEARFFVEVFRCFKDLYDNDANELEHSEACVNYDLALPCIKAMVNMVKKKGVNVVTHPGEEELLSMTKQLQQQGQTDKTDKILILKTSSAYEKATSDKAAFDHYKAMFGLLSVLRTLAEKYQYASFDEYKLLKIHFIHIHGDALRRWTLSSPDQGIYVMRKEGRADTPEKG